MIEEKKGNNIYRIVMLVILTAVLSCSATLICVHKFGLSIIEKEIQVEPAQSISDLPDYLKQINSSLQKYYRGEIKDEDLITGAIKGYVDGLGDPYTEYFTKEEMEEFETATAGNYVGIGIYMGASKNNEIVVISPIKGSPAEEAGIKSGDIISKVDGKEYTGDEMTEASNYIKGQEGTKVKLEIIRDSKILEFEVERKNIDIAPVESKILDGDIGYISLITFDEGCSDEIKDIIEGFSSKNVNGIILDLRDNGGGLVDEAIEILELFVDKGENLLITVDKNEKEDITKSKKSAITNSKLVVLTNEGSASASEIVSGTLKDLKRATIVGKTTYGKGVIQALFPMSDGSGLKVTIEEYYTAGRNKIHEIGIEPNVEVEENLDTEKDEQLEKAIEILKK